MHGPSSNKLLHGLCIGSCFIFCCNYACWREEVVIDEKCVQRDSYEEVYRERNAEPITHPRSITNKTMTTSPTVVASHPAGSIWSMPHKMKAELTRSALNRSSGLGRVRT